MSTIDEITMYTFKVSNIDEKLKNIGCTTADINAAWKRTTRPRKATVNKKKVNTNRSPTGLEFCVYYLLTGKDIFKHYSPKIPSEKRSILKIMAKECGKHPYEVLLDHMYTLINIHDTYKKVYDGYNSNSPREVIGMGNRLKRIDNDKDNIYNRLIAVASMTQFEPEIKEVRRSYADRSPLFVYNVLSIIKDDIFLLHDMLRDMVY